MRRDAGVAGRGVALVRRLRLEPRHLRRAPPAAGVRLVPGRPADLPARRAAHPPAVHRPARPVAGAGRAGVRRRILVAGISVLLLLGVAGLAVAGVWLLFAYPFPNLAVVGGVALLALAVALRPRFGRLDRDLDVLTEREAPELHALVREVATAVSGPSTWPTRWLPAPAARRARPGCWTRSCGPSRWPPRCATRYAAATGRTPGGWRRDARWTRRPSGCRWNASSPSGRTPRAVRHPPADRPAAPDARVAWPPGGRPGSQRTGPSSSDGWCEPARRSTPGPGRHAARPVPAGPTGCPRRSGGSSGGPGDRGRPGRLPSSRSPRRADGLASRL